MNPKSENAGKQQYRQLKITNITHNHHKYIRDMQYIILVGVSLECTQRRLKKYRYWVLAPNNIVYRPDLLLKSCKIFPMAWRLSYDSNASDRTRTGLRTGLKRTLECHCAVAGIVWLRKEPMSQHDLGDISGGSMMSAAAWGLGSSLAQFEPMTSSSQPLTSASARGVSTLAARVGFGSGRTWRSKPKLFWSGRVVQGFDNLKPTWIKFGFENLKPTTWLKLFLPMAARVSEP